MPATFVIGVLCPPYYYESNYSCTVHETPIHCPEEWDAEDVRAALKEKQREAREAQEAYEHACATLTLDKLLAEGRPERPKLPFFYDIDLDDFDSYTIIEINLDNPYELT